MLEALWNANAYTKAPSEYTLCRCLSAMHHHTTHTHTRTHIRTDRQTNRQTDKQADRQAGRQAGRQADREADRTQVHMHKRRLQDSSKSNAVAAVLVHLQVFASVCAERVRSPLVLRLSQSSDGGRCPHGASPLQTAPLQRLWVRPIPQCPAGWCGRACV